MSKLKLIPLLMLTLIASCGTTGGVQPNPVQVVDTFCVTYSPVYLTDRERDALDYETKRVILRNNKQYQGKCMTPTKAKQ